MRSSSELLAIGSSLLIFLTVGLFVLKTKHDLDQVWRDFDDEVSSIMVVILITYHQAVSEFRFFEMLRGTIFGSYQLLETFLTDRKDRVIMKKSRIRMLFHLHWE